MINSLDIYRGAIVIATIDIDEQTVFNEKLQGTKLISCAIKNPVSIPIQPEDYIIYRGERFTCNIVPDFNKDSETLAKDYSIVFEAEFYHLLDWFVEHEGNQDFSSYYGTARDHLNLVIASANLKSSGWAVGEVDETEEKSLPYSWTYVRTALDDIATAFGLEYQFTGKTIRMVKSLGRNTGLSFQMGRGKGLHQIKRSTDTSKSSVNRVYGVGGTKNIDSSYRDGTQKSLSFDGEYVQTPEVTAWLNGTGPEVRIKEGKYVNEDIYPKFKGVVATTTVSRDSNNKIITATITDPNIDFDINAQLQPGVKAHVSFLTGELTGIDFEISSYVPETKTITIIANTDTNGYVLPNDTSGVTIGDKFTLIDLRMTVQYVTNSQLDLKSETQTYLDDNKYDRLIYGVIPDEKVLRDNLVILSVGDLATVVDSEMEVNEILRFVEISYPLVNEYAVTGVIGNQIIYDRVIKLFADVNAVHQQISDIDRRGQEIAKRGAQNLRVLADSIFDVEGNFDSAKFNVGVLSALLGIFGLQSANFLLNKVFITANYSGDPNAVNISAGELFHLEYSNPGNQNVWQMQAITQNGLITGKEYYVYSKLSKTSQVGSFLITTDQIRPEDIPGFYTVRTGLIYPQIDGLRDVDFTYGITTVNGRQIKSGIIQGNTGALIINLDTGEIFGKMTFRASDGTIKDVVTVDNTAALAQANAMAAQTLADKANADLADIASDSKLTPNEKVTSSRDLTYINQEYPVRIQEASGYGVSTTAYTNAYDLLFTYINSNNLLFDLNSTSDIVSADFKNAFANYYTASVNLTKAISDAANNKIDRIGVNYSAGKMLYTDPEFSGQFGASGYNSINVYNNLQNGSVENGRGVNYGDFANNGLPANPNSTGCYLAVRYNASGPASPGFGGFFFGTQSRANAVFIARVVAMIPVGRNIQWASNEIGNDAVVGWLTSQAGTDKWEEYIIKVQCGTAGTFSSTNFFYISDGPAIDFFWYVSYATVFDMTAAPADPLKYADAQTQAAVAQANTYADSVAIAKANIAQANAIAQSSTTATNLSNTAYNNAVATSNAYAATVANSASSAAQISAAADASNKAQNAFNQAEANRIAQYNSLTAALRPLAYQDFVALSQLGDSIVENGRIRGVLVEAQGVWTNILNSGIINTQQLFSTSGTIGGWGISQFSLSGSNGGTTIELNVTNNDPFISVSNPNGQTTTINKNGIGTSSIVSSDVKINRALFISCDHVFLKNGTGINGEDTYAGRVGDYGSNGNALIERNGNQHTVNAYDITAAHFMTGNTVRYNTLTQLSDIRFKKGVKLLKYGLKEILELKPITYKYKFPKDDHMKPENNTHLGLSAQDVKAVMPEIVFEGERLTVSMVEIVPVLINAIKEQQEQINQLKQIS